VNAEHHYRLRAEWTGNRGSGTSGARDFDRSVTLSVEGKPTLLASADVPFRGDGSKWNPEDQLIGALAECHLLSYLYACVQAGVVVTAYEDDATGVIVMEGAGGAFREVVLRPRVTVASASMVEAATAAHRTARELCFIANSVNFPVRHEPTILVADTP
jgi:organic hydroperoxide reductase OsmC/OhrA